MSSLEALDARLPAVVSEEDEGEVLEGVAISSDSDKDSESVEVRTSTFLADDVGTRTF